MSVLQPLVESMPDARKITQGFQEHVKEKYFYLFSIAVPFGVDMWNRRSGGQSILRSLKLREMLWDDLDLDMFRIALHMFSVEGSEVS